MDKKSMLEYEVHILKTELERVKAEYLSAIQTTEELRARESGFEKELAKREEWVLKSEKMLEKAKEQSAGLRKNSWRNKKNCKRNSPRMWN